MKKNVAKTRAIDFGSSYGRFELSGVNCIIHKAQSRHKAIQGNIIRTLLRHFASLSLFIDSNSQLFFSHTRLYDAWAACDHTGIGRKTVAALEQN